MAMNSNEKLITVRVAWWYRAWICLRPGIVARHIRLFWDYLFHEGDSVSQAAGIAWACLWAVPDDWGVPANDPNIGCRWWSRYKKVE